MEIVVTGHNLPGRMFRSAGVPVHNVHAGIQIRKIPEQLVPADAASATWRVDVRVTPSANGAFEFAGPAVHGVRGERFLYLTWGDLGANGTFAMFRRAKLMLNRIDPAVVRRAIEAGTPLQARIDLTDGHGGPRCARVDPPHLTWTS